MAFFAVRQVIVYLLIFVMSTFIGRVSGASTFAAFTLFNLVFGLTYIVSDLGFGKSAMNTRREPTPGELSLAWLVNVAGALIFGLLLATGVQATYGDGVSSLLIALFFVSAAASFGPYSLSERAGDFVTIGTAEIIQVTVYVSVFFIVYVVTRDTRAGVLWAVGARIVGIPLSYVTRRRLVRPVAPDFGALGHVLQQTLTGFQHQASLILFALKDLVLAYVVLAPLSPETRGVALMAQTYMMIPLMFANPVSRVLLPRLSAAGAEHGATTVGRIMSGMALYAAVATAVVYVGFGSFDTLLLAGKFSAAHQLLPYFAAANLMSIPALAVASYLATTRGYRTYLVYALICSGLTWAVGAAALQSGGAATAYPLAVLAGHAVNLGLIAWFLVGRRVT